MKYLTASDAQTGVTATFTLSQLQDSAISAGSYESTVTSALGTESSVSLSVTNTAVGLKYKSSVIVTHSFSATYQDELVTIVLFDRSGSIKEAIGSLQWYIMAENSYGSYTNVATTTI